MTDFAENPQIEKPQAPETPKAETTGADDVQKLLKALEATGIKSEKDLTDTATAAQQAGRLANMLGEMRNENAELKRYIQQVVQQQVPRQAPQQSEENMDLKSLIKAGFREAYQEEILAPTLKQQEQFYAEMQEVMSDEDYPAVKDIFNEYVQNPAVQARLRSGGSTLTKEFNSVVRKFYKNITAQSYQTIKGLTQKGEGVQPPFMESSQSGNYAPPVQMKKRRDEINKIQQAGQGTDEVVEDMFNALFPKNDPFLRQRKG